MLTLDTNVLFKLCIGLLMLLSLLAVVIITQHLRMRALQSLLAGRAPKKAKPEQRRVQIITRDGATATVLATRHMQGWSIPWNDCSVAKTYYGKPNGEFEANDNLVPRRWAFEDTGRPEFCGVKKPTLGDSDGT